VARPLAPAVALEPLTAGRQVQAGLPQAALEQEPQQWLVAAQPAKERELPRLQFAAEPAEVRESRQPWAAPELAGRLDLLLVAALQRALAPG
jgi:hypothetical protein